MAKVLLLRSSEGKVFVAPSWDKRPTAQGRPLETGVPSRPLEMVVQFWIKHALAATSCQSPESLAAWDADFLRRLDHDGLRMGVAAAAQHLHLNDDLSELLSDFAGVGRPAASCAWHARAATRADLAAAARADLAVAWCAAGTDPATAMRAARSDPVRAWCAAHARADARSDHEAPSRRRGRKRAACRQPMSKSRRAATDDERSSCSSNVVASAVAPMARALPKVTAPAQQHPPNSFPAACSLRARRGLPELSCKCPKQNPLLPASRRLPIPA